MSVTNLDRTTVDVIPADWRMPVMNDLDMLKRIRTDETLKDIPVMMLTAVAEQGEVMNAFLAGMLGGSDAQPIQHL
mgnify:CR=1 FL=1|jgi:two-component system chemotaxis response regulator CheY